MWRPANILNTGGVSAERLQGDSELFKYIFDCLMHHTSLPPSNLPPFQPTLLINLEDLYHRG